MWSAIYRLADFARHRGRMRSWDADAAAGRRGEDIAHRRLQREGMTVVARNYRTPSGSGEIDLVAWDRGTLVFVEVKSRSSAEYGPPDRAVDNEKLKKIARAARDYARRTGAPWEEVRFDLITVLLTTPPAVSHYRDAFSIKTLANPSR
jgi:putative endonuclease